MHAHIHGEGSDLMSAHPPHARLFDVPNTTRIKKCSAKERLAYSDTGCSRQYAVAS